MKKKCAKCGKVSATLYWNNIKKQWECEKCSPYLK